MFRKPLAYITSFCCALVDFLYCDSLFSEFFDRKSDKRRKVSPNGETNTTCADRCPECNHNLTGNVSGACPECGREIKSP